MSGIEILATEQVAVAFRFDWFLFFISGLLLSIVFALLAWIIAEECGFPQVGTRIFVCVSIIITLAFAAFLTCISKYWCAY